MNDSKVSIIIPLYNVENSIDNLLEKLEKQTYKNIEVILINDGSTDKTADVVKNTQYNYSFNIIYKHQNNKGPGAARNLGISNATGDYTIFIDADDEFTDLLVESMVYYIKFLEVDVVQANYFIKQNDNNIQTIVSSNDDTNIIFGKSEIHSTFSNTDLINPYLWTKIFKTSILKEIRFPELYYSEDQVFLVKVFEKIEKLGLINQAYYTYVNNPNSIVRSDFNLKQLDSLKAMDLIIDFYNQYYPNLVHNYYVKNCKYIIYFYHQIPKSLENKELYFQLKNRFNEYYSLIKKNRNSQSNTNIKDEIWIFMFKYFPFFNKIVYKIK